MGYYYNVSASDSTILVNGVSDPWSARFTVPAKIRGVYSYRTGRRTPGTLALGESNLSRAYDSVTDYLKAEQTAIRELNSELESSSCLSEGTWGARDAGHVFSSVSQSRRHLRFRYGWNGSVGNGSDSAWYSPSVDPITSRIWSSRSRNAGEPLWYVGNSFNIEESDILTEASDLLWQTSPNLQGGTLGQDLVDLAQLPELLTHLRDVAALMDDLHKKWDRLDRDTQDVVDLLFRRYQTPYARKRATAKLRSLPKKSLSKGSSAYLEWEFVLSPYIDDLRLVLGVLARASGATLVTTRRSRRSRETRLERQTDQSPSIVGMGLNHPGLGSGIWPSIPDNWEMLRYDISLHAKWSLRSAQSDSFVQKALDLNQQLGIIYPSLLWDLAPWTFAIDWFLHIGTSIDRLYYLNNGQYIPVYAWATIKGSSGMGFSSSPRPFYNDPETIECPWPGMPVTNWTTRFPVTLDGGLKPEWSKLPSSARSLLAALGFSRLK